MNRIYFTSLCDLSLHQILEVFGPILGPYNSIRYLTIRHDDYPLPEEFPIGF